jgi:hypothetical protein
MIHLLKWKWRSVQETLVHVMEERKVASRRKHGLIPLPRDADGNSEQYINIEKTIPTEGPPILGEDSANFCG